MAVQASANGYKQLEGIDYRSGKAIQVTIAKGRIQNIVPIMEQEGLPIIAPGYVDLQINGYSGIDFNTPLLRQLTYTK